MTHAQIKKRVEKILEALPKDATAVQCAIRYGGIAELETKLVAVAEMVKQLDTDLAEGEKS